MFDYGRENALHLGGHHSITMREEGGVWSFCRGQIIYFHPIRQRAEKLKLYYMFV